MTTSKDQMEFRKKRALEKALGFLSRAIRYHRGRGVSHSYSFWLNPVNGFFPAYPEVTGYTIPTLIRAAEHLQQEELMELARSCADWLCEIQSPEGWFYGGIERVNGPSVFNSAMILFGLAAAVRKFDDQKYADSLSNCARWLSSVQEDDGRFIRFAWTSDFQPAYYTRVAWALLEAYDLLRDPAIEESVERLNCTLTPHFSSKSIQKAGFEPGQPAFLHTIAYALRGALEINRSMPETYDTSFLDKLVSEYNKNGQWPGQITFDPKNLPPSFDHEFRCLTGEAQMAVILHKFQMHREEARRTTAELLPLQGRFGKKKGALPGSQPVWGPYMSWRYPSWATKFLADALLEELENAEE